MATTKVDVNLIDASGITSSKFLKGDGTWGTVDALPSQTSQSGKFLTTDGSDASWATPDSGALVFISRTTVNSIVSDISINSGISTTYDNYRLIVNNLCVDTAGEDIKWGFRTTTSGTVADGAWVVQGGDTTNQNPYYYGASGNLTMARYITHDGGVNASIDIYNPFISTVRTHYTGLQGSYNTNRLSLIHI